jgi:hypothetical protein
MTEPLVHEPKQAVLTRYLVMISRHDTDLEAARLRGNWKDVVWHTDAKLRLEEAMESEDANRTPMGLGK